MKKVTLSLLTVVLALVAFVSVAGASEPVYLKDYDPVQYEALLSYYEASPYFTHEEAIAAADRITVDGVTLTEPTPTPIPTPTPTPETTPDAPPTVDPVTGTCTQEEWETIITASVNASIPPLLALEQQCAPLES